LWTCAGTARAVVSLGWRPTQGERHDANPVLAPTQEGRALLLARTAAARLPARRRYDLCSDVGPRPGGPRAGDRPGQRRIERCGAGGRRDRHGLCGSCRTSDQRQPAREPDCHSHSGRNPR